MAGGLALRKPRKSGPLISLVPMIDVMLILLVFFMVTSTYLNLDMIPAVAGSDRTERAGSAETPQGTLLIRLGPDGVPVLRGQPMTPTGLERILTARLLDEPLTQVLVLPSGAATTQALVSLMDTAARAGVVRLRVLRLEARP